MSPQDDWDRLLVTTFWPDFTRRRPRFIWQIQISFRSLHGPDITPDRWPDPWYAQQHVSGFVCTRLEALADRLTTAEGHPDIDATIAWLQRSGLKIRQGKTYQQRAEKWELQKVTQHYEANQIACAAFAETIHGNTKLGGGSKRQTRRKAVFR
jgi:hypothetical protein